MTQARQDSGLSLHGSRVDGEMAGFLVYFEEGPTGLTDLVDGKYERTIEVTTFVLSTKKYRVTINCSGWE